MVSSRENHTVTRLRVKYKLFPNNVSSEVNGILLLFTIFVIFVRLSACEKPLSTLYVKEPIKNVFSYSLLLQFYLFIYLLSNLA